MLIVLYFKLRSHKNHYSFIVFSVMKQSKQYKEYCPLKGDIVQSGRIVGYPGSMLKVHIPLVTSYQTITSSHAIRYQYLQSPTSELQILQNVIEWKNNSLNLMLYVPCIMFQCVDKPTTCNTSYE